MADHGKFTKGDRTRTASTPAQAVRLVATGWRPVIESQAMPDSQTPHAGETDHGATPEAAPSTGPTDTPVQPDLGQSAESVTMPVLDAAPGGPARPRRSAKEGR